MSETWLNKNYTDAEVNIDGYQLFRCDSPRKRIRGRQSGGVALYVRNDIACSFIPLLTYVQDEIQLLLLYSKADNLVIGTVYRRPCDNVHGHPSTPEDLKNALDKATEKIEEINGKTPDIIIGGDFNIPYKHKDKAMPKPQQKMMGYLESICLNLNLSQIVAEPTHKDGNILDLVLTNNLDLIHNHAVLPTLLSITHHRLILVESTLKVQQIRGNCGRPKRENFAKLNFFHSDIDWQRINDSLSEIDWDVQMANASVDNMLEAFYNLTLETARKHIPIKTDQNKIKKDKNYQLHRNLTRRRRRINRRLIKITSESTKLKLQIELVEIEHKLQKLYKNSANFKEKKSS